MPACWRVEITRHTSKVFRQCLWMENERLDPRWESVAYARACAHTRLGGCWNPSLISRKSKSKLAPKWAYLNKHVNGFKEEGGGWLITGNNSGVAVQSQWPGNYVGVGIRFGLSCTVTKL